MNKNTSKKNSSNTTIKSNETAAWANIEKLENISNVPIPSEFQVENAKKWVDENQK
ncbi:protein of unknown function [Caminicella sporogenes DSM 14501]|uniref:DUF3787 domain-containing protein n=1 Tax=Caminicella sporogenes DSM 14501 TaxID=1121266 RepID=A0A1M6NMQ2_9FIRM|nr:DUF3787 domain-containing protein [Caminicella sporogenes]RKD22151.1 DUF3787 domain-containing protein [Caminicella sporogenes]SHJ96963.1 protein of unknown function [Caminicella sporogenes DSM 14501]